MTTTIQISVSEKCVGLPDGLKSLASSLSTSQRHVLANCSVAKILPANDLRCGGTAFDANRETAITGQKIMLLKESYTRFFGGDNCIQV
jgi:hypothetical protein